MNDFEKYCKLLDDTGVEYETNNINGVDSFTGLNQTDKKSTNIYYEISINEKHFNYNTYSGCLYIYFDINKKFLGFQPWGE